MIESRSPGLKEFSVNQGPKEIYNSEEPREVLLAKTMFELCEGYEFDLVLTDEDNMKNVCTIWMIHNDLIKEVTVTNEEKLIPKPLDDQVMHDEATAKHPEPADDSDVVMFDDQDSSLEML